MDMDRQRRINSDIGVKIRAFFDDALKDADQLPGRAALKARIAEDFGDVPGINADKLGETFVAFARRAQRSEEGGLGHRFDLKGQIVELTDQLVGKLEAADRIIEVEDDEPVDMTAVADAATDSFGKSEMKAMTRLFDEEDVRRGVSSR